MVHMERSEDSWQELDLPSAVKSASVEVHVWPCLPELSQVTWCWVGGLYL